MATTRTIRVEQAGRPHDFEKVNPADLAETVIRQVMREMDDKPLSAEFFRGLDPNSRSPRVMYEHVRTGAVKPGAGRVLILPVAQEVAICAQACGPLGWDVVPTKARVLAHPTSGGDVDLDALAGETFRAQLVAVIEDRLADIENHGGAQ